MLVDWQTIKNFVVDRNTYFQYLDLGTKYWLFAFDGPFKLECLIEKTLEEAYTADFETNFKALGNKSPKQEVLTQAEKNDKDKRIAKGTTTASPNSTGHIFIKCPGTINLDSNGYPITNIVNDRWVNGGSVICNNAQDGDWVEVNVSLNNDPNNLVVVRSYSESEENSDGKNGWYIDATMGSLDLESASPSHLYGGFYLHIAYHAVSGGTTRKVYANIDWDQKS